MVRHFLYAKCVGCLTQDYADYIDLGDLNTLDFK